MLLRAVVLMLATTLSAHADVAETVQGQALPGYAAFAAATADLSAAADRTCEPEALRDGWNSAFDAWLRVQHYRLGPAEEEGRGLAIAFWPDPKGAGQRALAALLSPDGPPVDDPAVMAEVSVAGRGLFALERLLYGEASGERACAVTRAVAADLARMADETQAGWTDGFAETLLTAGETGNTTFLSAREARQAVFTQLIGGFEFVADQRLGRPLGSLDRPRPERAEARLSGRTIRNISLSLDAFGTMAAELVPETPKTQAAIARAERLAAALPPDTFARLGDPQIWLKVQILQQAVHVARDAALAEIGPALDVGVGFNAADGD